MQDECGCVRRFDHPKVAVVERGDVGDPEPFGDRDHRRVDGTQRKIGVLADEVLHALQVGCDQLGVGEGAVDELVQEGRRGVVLAPAFQEVADLNDNGRGTMSGPGAVSR